MKEAKLVESTKPEKKLPKKTRKQKTQEHTTTRHYEDFSPREIMKSPLPDNDIEGSVIIGLPSLASKF